jgi:hypothetical protein
MKPTGREMKMNWYSTASEAHWLGGDIPKRLSMHPARLLILVRTELLILVRTDRPSSLRRLEEESGD